MDIVNVLNKNQNSRKEVCAVCKYIQRPFQEDLDNKVFCEKMKRTVEFIKTNSCANWEQWAGVSSDSDFL